MESSNYEPDIYADGSRVLKAITEQLDADFKRLNDRLDKLEKKVAFLSDIALAPLTRNTRREDG